MSSLHEPILEGIKNIHFFNGRLLTAEDMQAEQNANRQQHAQLGKAIGAGVVSGLEVVLKTADPPALKVTAGCAVNRLGQVIELKNDEDEIALTITESEHGEAGELFSDCDAVVSASLDSDLDNGVFVLTVSPVSDYEGEAPKHETFNEGTATGCGRRYVVEGVQFRLVAMKNAPALSGSEDLAGLSRYRSTLAHWFFHTDELTDFPDAPFPLSNGVAESPWTAYGPLDEALNSDAGSGIAEASESELLACETPLAVLCWDGSVGIRLLDMWPVRRRLTSAFADRAWPFFTQERRLAEAHAVFLHFQAHLAWLESEGVDLSDANAKTYFRYLPPAGVLPLARFDRDTFFEDFETDQVRMDAAFVRSLLHHSFLAEPIDLDSPALPRLELYQLDEAAPDYLIFVRQEDIAVAAADTETSEEPSPEPDVNRFGDVEITLTVVKAYDDVFNPKTAKVVVENRRLAISRQAAYSPRSRSIFDRRKILRETTSAVFKASDLAEAVDWVVTATVAGFRRTSESSIKIVGDSTTKVTLFLVPNLRKTPGSGTVEIEKPGRELAVPEVICTIPGAGWIDPPKPYDKIGVVCEDWKFPWPDPGPYVSAGDPPPDVIHELIDVAESFQEAHPDIPMDPGSPTIYIDKSRVPGTASEEPYAYLVLGKGGPYAPVILTDPTSTLPATASTRSAGDIDVAGYEDTLGNLPLDMLAAAPTSVLRSLGIRESVVEGVQASLRAAVGELQDSPRLFQGVDTETAARLEAAGIGSLRDLANADRAALTEVVGGELFARRLIEDARAAVPSDSWSLDGLDLGSADRGLLEANNLDSKGALERALESDNPAHAVLTETVGLTDEQLSQLGRNIGAAKETATASRRKSQPLNKIGVDESLLSQLAGEKVYTIGDLAALDESALADKVGTAKAAELREQLNRFLG